MENVPCAVQSGPEPDNAVRERQRQKRREYYMENRERIRAQQREYYQRKGKAAHADRVRTYRQQNHEKVCAQRREYRANHAEKCREWDRRYREAHSAHRQEPPGAAAQAGPQARSPLPGDRREELNRKKRAYYWANREAILEAQRRRYQENPDPGRERSRLYYQKNRQELCRRKLEQDCYRSIQAIRERIPERVEQYLQQYPFEEYGRQQIVRELLRRSIPPSSELYMECYDAGMLAYLYSVHRCAAMGYTHTPLYIMRMIRCLVTCALVVTGEIRALCRENGLTEYRIDREELSCRL